MKQTIDPGFAERRKAAGEAKKRLLEKVAPALRPDTPEALARRAEKLATAAAREQRRAERDRLRQETAEREKAAAAERAETEAAAIAAHEAERKAERDRRYAARKARKQ